MKTETERMLWVESYRPTTIQECILPKRLKKAFTDIVKSGDIPNMILTGSAGLGKTTVARALCAELGFDYLFMNASMEANMENLRTKMQSYASTVSLHGGIKVIILDEADGIPPKSQDALRTFMESFSGNCRFIKTCNFKNKLIDALHSRSSVYDFTLTKAEQVELAPIFTKRVFDILKEESVEYDSAVILEVVKRHMPDWRRIINETQRHARGGSIQADALIDLRSAAPDALLRAMKTKDFRAVRAWVAENADVETVSILRSIYNGLNDYFEPSSVPQVVLILAEYDYKSAFVADAELNTVACMTEIMASAKFK